MARIGVPAEIKNNEGRVAVTPAGVDALVARDHDVRVQVRHFRDDLTLFTYLHLAADRPLTAALMQAGTTAIAYETVQLPDRTLPLLSPMSEVAGRLSITVGSHFLMQAAGAAEL